ncbi:MAG: hypothetical protein ACO2PM_23410 [Pyrobaculum sp.]|jgi:hypothetical protein
MSTDKTEPAPNLKRKMKTKVRIKVRDAGEEIEYEAVAKRSDGEVLEISGSTYCFTVECVKQIIKRALTGRRDLPEDVEKAVKHVINHLLVSIKLFGADDVSSSLWLDVGLEAELGISAGLYYLDGGEVEDEEEYIGWVAEIRAKFSGCDGAAAVDGFHEFKKELMLGGHLDDAAVKRLTKELMGLVKLAYNVSKA